MKCNVNGSIYSTAGEAGQGRLVRIALRVRGGKKQRMLAFACKTTFHEDIKLSDAQRKNCNK